MRIVFRPLIIASVFVAALAVPSMARATHCQTQGLVEVGSDAVHANIPCGPASGGAAGAAGGGGASTVLVNPIGGTTQNPSGTSDVPHILGNVLRALFGVLGSIALLMFIYGGFLWLTSGGAAEKIQKGKETMVWAILGIAIIFASFAIVSFVIDRLTAG